MKKLLCGRKNTVATKKYDVATEAMKDHKILTSQQTTALLQHRTTTKTQNSIATDLLGSDIEGKSRPKFLGIHT